MSDPVFVSPTPSAATQEKFAAELCVRAKRLTIRLIKDRARAFAEHPLTLEVLCSGLATAGPQAMAEVARQLIDAEIRTPRRWFGFGGEIPILNAKAVALLARVRRRAAYQQSQADRRSFRRPQDIECT